MKTLKENFIDWENYAFGFGYGTGEEYTLAALKTFLTTVPAAGYYNYAELERVLTPTVAWLMINLLCRHDIDIVEYGASPHGGWLAPKGEALQKFFATKSIDELVELCTGYTEDYVHCYPDACNCGPKGYEPGRACPNPFWGAE